MSKSLLRYRTDAFRRQAGRCYYCTALMWMDDGVSFARKHELSSRAARWLRCTAEHLLARRDGGRDSRNNIVAACWHCNLRRHRGRKNVPTPDAYREQVRRRLARGSWHVPQVLRCGLVRLHE